MADVQAEKGRHLMVSRRGIVHVTESLEDNAATACGKGSRDFVLIGAIGPGERMCSVCRLRSRPGTTGGGEHRG